MAHGVTVTRRTIETADTLFPATFSLGILYSIPEELQGKEQYICYWLYLVLLGCILLSITSSAAAATYLYKEADTEIERQNEERRKNRILMVGLVATMFAVVCRLLLQLAMESAVIVLVGCVVSALFLRWCLVKRS